MFRKLCLRQSEERTNRDKTRIVLNTYLNVTFEDRNVAAQVAEQLKTVTHANPPMEERSTK